MTQGQYKEGLESRCKRGASKRALCSLSCRDVHRPACSQSDGEPQPQSHGCRCRTRPALCQAHQRGLEDRTFCARPLVLKSSSQPPKWPVRGSKPKATASPPLRQACPNLVFPMEWQRPPDTIKQKSLPQQHAREGSEKPGCLQNSNTMHRL